LEVMALGYRNRPTRHPLGQVNGIAVAVDGPNPLPGLGRTGCQQRYTPHSPQTAGPASDRQRGAC
jgi:hypothetical protein